jgi:hypothetical protein
VSGAAGAEEGLVEALELFLGEFFHEPVVGSDRLVGEGVGVRLELEAAAG